MSYPVQLLKWDHTRFRALLNYLQGMTRDPAPRDARELGELYTLLKPAVQGRHRAQEETLWQRLREQDQLEARQRQQLLLMQERLTQLGQELERKIRSSGGKGTITSMELSTLTQPFIECFRATMEMEERLFPLLENPCSSSHHRQSRHGIDLKYRVRPQE